MNTSMPLISVIVPVYRVEKYLHRCVESILAQTYTNLEIILVNDGSPDNSGKICDKYAKKDSRIKVIHKKNGGVSSARNAGLKIVIGNYVTFIDSDDYISESYIHTLFSSIKDSDICCCMYREITEAGKTIRVVENLKKTTVMPVNENFNYCFTQCNMMIFGKLFKKSILNNLWFDNNVSLGEDSLFFAKAILNSKSITYIPNILYSYVKYENSLSHGVLDNNKFSVIDSWVKISTLFKNHPVSFLNSVSHLSDLCFKWYLELIVGDYSKELQNDFYNIITSDEVMDFLKLSESRNTKFKLFFLRNFKHIYNIILILKYR